MKIINLQDMEKQQVDMEGAKNLLKQLPISSADGSPHFSFRVFTIEPGGHTPYHRHAAEHLNFVIAGAGALVDEAGKETPLKTGDFALVLPNEKHQYSNREGKTSMVMICAVPKQYE